MFVGRDRELGELEQALARATSGDGAFALISGEAGIGKSRLAEELSRRAHDACVAWGRAWEGEGTPPYWPWLEILRVIAADPRTAGAIDRELAALIDGRALTPGFRALDALGGAIRAAATAAPLVIVLDDLHVADAASLELLAFVTGRLRGVRALIVGTTRDHAGLRARPTVSLPLGRLAAADVARWVEGAAPELRDRGVFDSSDGNPLFVSELIATWRSDATPRTPRGLRDVIAEHLARVSPAARRVLEAASVFGREARIAALRAVVDVDPGLDEAIASSILVAGDDTHARFSHVLVRDELYAGIARARRLELHRAAMACFPHEPAIAVQHALAAAEVVDPREVVGVVVDAMREASARLAFDHAATLGERALGILRTEDASLLIALGEAWIAAGDGDRGRAICARAAAIAGDAEVLARAALAHASEQRLGRHEPSVTLLRRAIAAEPADPRLRAQLLSKLATSIIPPTPEEQDEPIRLARESLAAARDLGDDATLFATSSAMFFMFPHEFALGERFALGGEILALARRVGKLPLAASVPFWQIVTWLELGRLDAARKELDHGLALFAELPPHHAWRGDLLRAFLLGVEGKLDESAAIARRVATTCDVYEARHLAGVQLMALPYLGAELPAADADVILETSAGRPGSEIFLAFAHATAGRVDQVRAAITAARGISLAGVPGAAGLGWAVVRAGLAEHAEVFYELARDHAARSPLLFGPGITLGPADLLAGRLAQLGGRPDLARPHLERALAYTERLGAPVLAELTRGALAEAPALVSPASPSLVVERRGEVWAIAARGREILVDDRRGLGYLATLVASPFRDLHVLELAGIEEEGDAGPLLDAKAKQAYRERAESLRDALAAAEARADLGRAERAREELSALADELARAVGLGGRDRRAGSAAERARINVQRRLRDVVRRVAELDAGLGRHLELSLKTGTFCRYAPTWEHPFQATERP